MYVSVETLTTIVGVVSVLASLAAGFAWMIRRMDALEVRLTGRTDALEGKLTGRTDALEGKLTGRTDALDGKLNGRLDALDDKLSARIDAVEHEVIEVKIAVARLEGPQQRLIVGR